MFDYVWSETRMGRLGRPNSTVDDYFLDSEAKIAMWRAEQARTNSAYARAKLKNKISALRSRMKLKISKDEQRNQNLACYQSNFRMIIKSLLEVTKPPQRQLYV